MNRSTLSAVSLLSLFGFGGSAPAYGTHYGSARSMRSREEQVRRIADAQMKRERRRLRPCGSST